MPNRKLRTSGAVSISLKYAYGAGVQRKCVKGVKGDGQGAEGR